MWSPNPQASSSHLLSPFTTSSYLVLRAIMSFEWDRSPHHPCSWVSEVMSHRWLRRHLHCQSDERHDDEDRGDTESSGVLVPVAVLSWHWFCPPGEDSQDGLGRAHGSSWGNMGTACVYMCKGRMWLRTTKGLWPSPGLSAPHTEYRQLGLS